MWFELIQELYLGLDSRVSVFIPNEKITPLGLKPNVNPTMLKDFSVQGRLSNLSRTLAYFPKFYDRFSSTFNTLMYSAKGGPLPNHIRNYLAIMAASQYHCDYLLAVQKHEFILNGGKILGFL
jgi:hypothetical protein